MLKFTAIATAFALLVHSLLGCCCHHAHAQSTTGPSATGEKPSATYPCSCQHHAESASVPVPSQGLPEEEPFPADPCDEGNCTLLASDNLSSTSLWLHLAASLSTLVAAPPQPLSDVCGALIAGPSPHPAPTLVELHQILRI